MVQPKPQVSCRITAAIFAYADRHELPVDELCAGLPHTRAQLEDTRGWVERSEIQTIWERLVAFTHNPHIAAEVGLAAMKENVFGAVGTIIRLYGSMSRLLHSSERMVEYFSNYQTLKGLRIGSSSALMEWTIREDVSPSYHYILFMQGVLAGIPILWDMPMAHVEITRLQCSVAECGLIDGRVYQVTGEGNVRSHAADNPDDWRDEGKLNEAGEFNDGQLIYGAPSTLFHISWESRPSRWWLQRIFPTRDAVTDTVNNLESDLRAMESLYAELQETSANLQRMVAERTAELEKANRELAGLADKLKRQSQLKSEFIADFSHELRTLISAIVGFSELLVSETYGKLNEKQREACERISSNTRVLMLAVNDLLDLARLQAGKLDVAYEPVNVRDIINETGATITPLAEEKGLILQTVISPEAPVRILTDRAKVNNILLNLLSNAVKYTDRGRVTLRAFATEPGTVVFSVEDTGRGIDPVDLPMLFEEFAQVARTQGTQAHTTMGLRITKKLVDLLHGSIEVGSQPGVGSEFTVALPVRPAEAEGELEDESGIPDPARNRHTVVVADSDQENAVFLRLSLEAVGLRAETCADGRQVLRKIAIEHADLLILDPLIHHRDGWQILRDLRAAPETQMLPVIVVTENVQEQLAKNFAVAASFRKPYPRDAVVGRVLQLLKLADPGQ